MTALQRLAACGLLFLSLASGTGAPAHAADSIEARVDPRARVPALRAEGLEEEGADATDRVFGGKRAKAGAWPFQLAFLNAEMLDESGESQYDAQFCGGSLIAPQWVLTAAHCLVDEDGKPYKPDTMAVLSGATNLKGGKRTLVSQVIVHESYDPARTDNDVGLVKLAEPIVGIAPVKLADSGFSAEHGPATVIGWGLMEDGTTPEDLMQVDVDLQPASACNAGIKNLYRQDYAAALDEDVPPYRVRSGTKEALLGLLDQNMLDPLSSSMICAGKPKGEVDACNGDSGGPLLVTADGAPLQVGVVSWGAGPADAEIACGIADAYGVYSSVPALREWIKAKSGV